MSGTIYTYPDNFRAIKALVAAQYSGVDLKVDDKFVFGETNTSKDFLSKFPLGKVPVYESADGLRLTQSNAIAYHVANEQLRNGFAVTDQEKQNFPSLIQCWMSFADNELTPAACAYAFPLIGVSPKNSSDQNQAKTDFSKVLSTMDKHLANATYLVGERVTLADICNACSLLIPCQFACDPAFRKSFGNVTRWFMTVVNQPQFKAVIGELKLCEKVEGCEYKQQPKKQEKESKKKQEPKKKQEEPEEELLLEAPKPAKDPFSAFEKGSWDMDDFKRFYSNNEEKLSIPYFFEKFDKAHYSVWLAEYNYNDELVRDFMSSNLISGMFQRLDKLRKNAFASVCLFGADNNATISGIWVWKGDQLAFELSPDWQVDYESYTWTKLDYDKPETKSMIERYFKWEGKDKEGREFKLGNVFK